MQGNQSLLCGPAMRSNCCFDSHSAIRHVSCKKGSISSAARTRACSPPLLLLLLWDVAAFRGKRSRGDGVIVLESTRRPHENGRAAFSDFSTLRPVLKKVSFQVLRFQDPYGRSAKTMQYMCVFRKTAFSCGRRLSLAVLDLTLLYLWPEGRSVNRPCWGWVGSLRIEAALLWTPKPYQSYCWSRCSQQCSCRSQ